MVLSEAQARVCNIYEGHKNQFGYIKPSRASIELAPENPQIAEQIRRKLYRHPTKDFIYHGAKDALQMLVHTYGDSVSIWTDDWLWRVGTSSLADVRCGLSQEERRRFTVTSGEHKIPLLFDLLDQAWHKKASAVVVIDNNMDNLRNGANALAGHTVTPVYFVWKGEGLSHQLPWDTPLQFLPFNAVSSVTVDNLLPLRERVLSGEKGRNVLWAVDFNETLLDTPSYEQSMLATVASSLQAAA